MNTDTGQIYRGPEVEKAMEEAFRRGQTVVPVSEKVAQTMEAGERFLNRAARRLQAREDKRAAKRAARGVAS